MSLQRPDAIEVRVMTKKVVKWDECVLFSGKDPTDNIGAKGLTV